MKGDFSRNTFAPDKHFSRVLMQQGRVQLDADWNEQVSILLHYLRTLATDIIGPHGGPNSEDLGFTITSHDPDKFHIGQGRYYVDGILCENEADIAYGQQPGYPFPDSTRIEDLNDTHLVYLEAWERHLTYVEDEDLNGDEPSIREVALGKADTASRAQVVWQVKAMVVESEEEEKWEFIQLEREFEKVRQLPSLVTTSQVQLQLLEPDVEDQATISSLRANIKQLKDIKDMIPSLPDIVDQSKLEELAAVLDTLTKISDDATSLNVNMIESLKTQLGNTKTAITTAEPEIKTIETLIEHDKQKIEAFLQQKKLTLSRAKLRARAQRDPDKTYDPCTIPPESRYRGAENQLYRVEAHKGGQAGDGATFKWSRENGSVIFPIVDFEPEFGKETAQNPTTDTALVTLRDLGRDDLRFGLKAGNWVEVVDDDYTLRGAAEALWQVDDIKPAEQQVLLKRTRNSGTSTVGQQPTKHPLLRRWDHQEGDPGRNGLTLDGEGTAIIKERSPEVQSVLGQNDDNWLTLEDGIQIQFQRSDPPSEYRTGDYWLIPARTATGDVEWPGPAGDPQPEPPNGVIHHYAPLAIISSEDGEVKADCRRTFEPLGTSAS